MKFSSSTSMSKLDSCVTFIKTPRCKNTSGLSVFSSVINKAQIHRVQFNEHLVCPACTAPCVPLGAEDGSTSITPGEVSTSITQGAG